MGAGAFRLPRRGRARLRVVGIVAVMAVATVVLFMGVAFAHHPILSGEAVCTNGDHEITWTIANSEASKVMTITSATATKASHTYAVTDYSSTVPGGGSTLATTIVPGSTTGNIKLKVIASWTDGATKTEVTHLQLDGTCTGEPTTAPTTWASTTVPRTTVPEWTVPESTVPESTVPESTVPESTVPESTVPRSTVPESTVPKSTVPESTVPESTVPESTVPESTVPESTTIMTLGSTAVPTTIPEGTTAPKETTSTVAAAGATATTAHPTSTTAAAAQSSAEQQHNTLPFTGSDSWPPLLGLAALVLGGALTVVTRRRHLRRS